MQVTGTDNLWALGDCAVTINAFDGKPTPPTAQFALREAKQLAKNLVRRIDSPANQAFPVSPSGAPRFYRPQQWSRRDLRLPILGAKRLRG